MSGTKKKPAVVLEHDNGQGKAISSMIKLTPKFYYTDGVNALQEALDRRNGRGRVWPLLGSGSDNAISPECLAELLETSERGVRHFTAAEREAGLPIITRPDCAGYFKPTTLDDILVYARAMRKRADHSRRAAEAAERFIDEVVGQCRLEGF